MNLFFEEFSRLKTLNCFGCQYKRPSLWEHDCCKTHLDCFYQIEAVENVKHLLHPATYDHIVFMINTNNIQYGGEANASF